MGRLILRIKKTDFVGISAMGLHGKTWLGVWMCLNRGKGIEAWIVDVNREKIYRRLAEKDPTVHLIHERRMTVGKADQICTEAFNRGNVRIFFDEAHQYIPSKLDLKSEKCKYWGLKDVFFQGRHRFVTVNLNTRRFSMISPDLFSQCDHVFIGKLFSMADYNHARTYVRSIKDWERITKLPKRTWYHFCDKGSFWRKTPIIKLGGI